MVHGSRASSVTVLTSVVMVQVGHQCRTCEKAAVNQLPVRRKTGSEVSGQSEERSVITGKWRSLIDKKEKKKDS